MIPLEAHPPLNAALNAVVSVLLAAGFGFIRAKRVAAHKACMLTAVAVSAVFLASYLYYHYHAGSTPFQGQGFVRTLYFTILISHTILATVILPLVIITVTLALRGRIERHRRIARWTMPLWFYVSVTGVVIYWMLYQMPL
jgi:putative membrane protein